MNRYLFIIILLIITNCGNLYAQEIWIRGHETWSPFSDRNYTPFDHDYIYMEFLLQPRNNDFTCDYYHINNGSIPIKIEFGKYSLKNKILYVEINTVLHYGEKNGKWFGREEKINYKYSIEIIEFNDEWIKIYLHDSNTFLKLWRWDYER